MEKRIFRLSPVKTIGLIVLSILIAGCFTYALECAFGLDEIIDNYTNEDYVTLKDDVVRNTSLNCMELEYSAGIRSYENFSSWVETDALNRLTQNSSRSTFTGLQRTDHDITLEKNYGKTPNWYMEFEVKITTMSDSGTAVNRFCILGIANVSNDFRYFPVNDVDYIGLLVRTNTSKNGYWVSVYETDGATDRSEALDALVKDSFFDFAEDVTYYWTFNKTGRNIDAHVYSNTARTIHIANATWTLNDDHVHTILMCPQSCDYDNYAYPSDGWIQWLWTGDVTGGYEDDGVFYTTNILDSVNGSSVDFLYNITLGNGDSVTVEMSLDNSTWVDHNGNAGGDTLIQGLEGLDLRDLNYTTIYFRFNLTDGGLDSTPRIYQIIVHHSGGAVSTIDNTGALLVVGICTGIIIGIGVIFKR